MGNNSLKAAIAIGVATALAGIGIILTRKGSGGNGGNGGDTCDTGYHWDKDVGACVPDDIAPPVDDTEMTPAAIWARAQLLFTEVLNADTIENPVVAAPPPIEIVDFKVTKVYEEPRLVVFEVDKWWERLNSEDDAVIAEIAGDPCNIDAGGRILPCVVGERIGQLRGHTWGSRLNVYEWNGASWDLVYSGNLGPNQGYGTPQQYELCEAQVTIKSSQNWIVPPGMIIIRVVTNPAGNWKYYTFDQGVPLPGQELDAARADWIHLTAGVSATFPVVLRAYSSESSSWHSGPMALGNYTALVDLEWSGCCISYNDNWYDPLSSKEDPKTDEEMGFITGEITEAGATIVGFDTSIRHTIFSYSISQYELMNEVMKVWYTPGGCRCYGPSFGVPQGNSTWICHNLKVGPNAAPANTIYKQFVFSVANYGDQ